MVLLGLGAAIGLAGCDNGKTMKDVTERQVSTAEVRRLVAQSPKHEAGWLVLVDPRAAEDFRAGHLPGAQNFTVADVPLGRKADPVLQDAKHVIVYGENPGSAAGQAMALRLLQLGVENKWYAGGLQEWAKEGGVVEKTAPR